MLTLIKKYERGILSSRNVKIRAFCGPVQVCFTIVQGDEHGRHSRGMLARGIASTASRCPQGSIQSHLLCVSSCKASHWLDKSAGPYIKSGWAAMQCALAWICLRTLHSIPCCIALRKTEMALAVPYGDEADSGDCCAVTSSSWSSWMNAMP